MARPRKLVLPSDPILLQAMVDGLEMQKQRLDAQIAAVKAALGGRAGKVAAKAPLAAAVVAAPAAAPASRKASGAKPKRQLSAAAREAIAAAQRKRWAKFRKDTKAAGE